MKTAQSQKQGEVQLLAEWLTTLPANYITKTHVKVGAATLLYGGVPLTPAQQRAFSVWSDWADARVVTPGEVWIVEAKLVGTGCGYGQVLDYCNQYKGSADYQAFFPRPIIPVVLCQAERQTAAVYFAGLGVRTILFTPSFSVAQSLGRLFPAAQVLNPGVVG